MHRTLATTLILALTACPGDLADVAYVADSAEAAGKATESPRVYHFKK